MKSYSPYEYVLGSGIGNKFESGQKYHISDAPKSDTKICFVGLWGRLGSDQVNPLIFK